MKLRILIGLGLAAGLAGALPVGVKGEEKPADSGAAAVEGDKALQDLSKASEALYKKVSGGLVRVRMENVVGLGMTQQMSDEYDDWRKKQLASGRGPGRDARPDHRGDAAGAPPATTMPARTGAAAGPRRFLEQKLKDAPDAETQGRVRAILARLDAARNGQGNEVMGVVIDDQGHTLVAWSRDNTGTTFRVIGADGTEVGAKYVGAHAGRGFAVLKLDNLGTGVPLAMAAGRPAGGELLMCMTARQGAVGWVTAPATIVAPAAGTIGTNGTLGTPGSAGSTGTASAAKKPADDRFAVFGGDEHGATYLFNTNGELAAIGIEKFALPIEGFKTDIKWIIDNNKDISPRLLGVSYTAVLPEMRRKLPALGNRPAALVSDVAKGSLAEKAGLKKDDIVVSIEDVSIALLPKIQMDLATRSGSVPMEIFRGGVETTLELSLGEK